MTGKLIRKNLTDTIKTEIVDKSNSSNSKFAYLNYSKLINKSLGLETSVDRNSLPSEILIKIAKREDLVRSLINEGKSCQEIKSFLLSFIQKKCFLIKNQFNILFFQNYSEHRRTI
jgi:hypothetical protein